MKGFGNLIIAGLCVAIVLFSFSCNKEKKVLEKNIEEIEQYISDNDLSDLGSVVKTESSLHYIVTKDGDGYFPTIDDKVKVNYKGYLINNEVFDESQNLEFPLTAVIKGWQEGIPKFSRGGSGYLLIPSELGYGSSGQGSIPGDAVLIFEIDLLDF